MIIQAGPMEKLTNILAYQTNAWAGYLISHLVEPQQEAQWDDEWSVLERACGPGINAVLFHNCLSHAALFPRRRADLEAGIARRGIRLLNAGLADMRKRTLHGMLERAGVRCARAARQGPGDQRLFVKTNLNFGGKAERALPPDLWPLFDVSADCPIRAWNDYRLLRRDEIDPAWWDNPDLVIENYIAHDDTLYRIYGCGDVLICILAHSGDLIKKEDEHPEDRWVHVDRRDLWAGGADLPHDLPDDLRRQLAGFTAHYPFDYFCLDVVHDGTNHTIIDLNLTPFCGLEPPKAAWLGLLRRGLHDLTRQAAA